MNNWLEEISRLKPNLVHDYILKNFRIASEFNWLSLAVSVSQNATIAFRDGDFEVSKVWSLCAVLTYEKLALETSSILSKVNMECSAVRERAKALNRFGRNPHDELLNEEIIVTWFNSVLKLGPFRIERLKNDDFDAKSYYEVHVQRALKNAISAVQTINDRSGKLEFINEWIGIKNKLS